MKCAIMQPTYLPWAGYFQLMASVNTFIFLDDVQFSRRSWHSRNRILLNDCEHLLTVPVIKSDRGESISKILIQDAQPWREKHIACLAAAYERSPYGKMVLDLLIPYLENREIQHLSDLTIGIIEALCGVLQIENDRYKAIDLNCEGSRSEHLALLCQKIGADCYVAAEGSREYLEEDEFEKRYGIKLEFHSFVPAEYQQVGASKFFSHLSIVDVLANLGQDHTRAYLDMTMRQ